MSRKTKKQQNQPILLLGFLFTADSHNCTTRNCKKAGKLVGNGYSTLLSPFLIFGSSKTI